MTLKADDVYLPDLALSVNADRKTHAPLPLTATPIESVLESPRGNVIEPAFRHLLVDGRPRTGAIGADRRAR